MIASVGSRGDSHDNGLAESFNGLYKKELVKVPNAPRACPELVQGDGHFVHMDGQHGVIALREAARDSEAAIPQRNALLQLERLHIHAMGKFLAVRSVVVRGEWHQ